MGKFQIRRERKKRCRPVNFGKLYRTPTTHQSLDKVYTLYFVYSRDSLAATAAAAVIVDAVVVATDTLHLRWHDEETASLFYGLTYRLVWFYISA